MRRVFLVTAGLSLATVVLFGAWRLSRSRTTQLFGDLVHRVETDRKVVALTFDDGPTPQGTRRVLTILDSLEAKATFFVTGAEVLKRPRFVREELVRTDSPSPTPVRGKTPKPSSITRLKTHVPGQSSCFTSRIRAEVSHWLPCRRSSPDFAKEGLSS